MTLRFDARVASTLPAPRVLDFDIENRPLSYWYDGQCTAEITAIAWSFGDGVIECVLLGRDHPVEMLLRFRAAYDAADQVTGHYIRKHDLPIINASMVEYGLPILAPKLTIDTKLDLVRTKDLSQSQESLGAMLGLQSPKQHMTQTDWRQANRLERLDLAEARVTADVRQHMELRRVLDERGLLRPPKMWRP